MARRRKVWSLPPDYDPWAGLPDTGELLSGLDGNLRGYYHGMRVEVQHGAVLAEYARLHALYRGYGPAWFAAVGAIYDPVTWLRRGEH